jgi:hypothetical protein
LYSQGAMLSPAFKVREFNVEDTFPYPLAFTWKKADPDTGVPTDEDHTEVGRSPLVWVSIEETHRVVSRSILEGRRPTARVQGRRPI